MTREIKARVWDKLEGCWKYITMGRESLNPAYYDFDTMGQYIRRKDKDDVEIYDGAIMEFRGKPYSGRKSRRIYTISWDDVDACWNCENEENWMAGSEYRYGRIIGNIHENPELLEETKCPT